MSTYNLRRPHFDRVLSEIYPMIGSVIASNILGTNWMIPHRRAANPRSCTNTMMKTPKAAGNIWLASIPKPNAIFCPIETLDAPFEF